MDSADICAATSRGDNKRRVANKKNRDWHKLLRLRKTAVQPPTMQSEDKHGPKKIAEEWEQSAVWPSSKKPPEEEQQQRQQGRHRTNDGGNTLRFTCSQCRDDLEYVPTDLVRHFEENHRGSPPVFSCRMCTFSTHEFSYLQVHLLSHKDTFSSCSICNDDVQRTWPEFSAHLTAHHCHNGRYSCETCQKFSTVDVGVFLEHAYAHSLGPKGKNKFGPKATTQTLRCQHCGYEASQKWAITKHVKAVHVCQNGNRRKRKKKEKEEVNSLVAKPNDTIPKMKPRLTRSAVREMCWLTQDCLSLPGREFLDKYCHLSDPQATLAETQQFLMKSVAGETGDRKWTKALKTVLSNVPKDMNLHPKSENGVVTSSSDLTVLTVKNKITVAQNGATYAKRLKMTTTSSDKVSPESGCPSHSSDRTETKPISGGSVAAQSEPSERTQIQENRENRELKSHQEFEEHSKITEEPAHEDGIDISSDLKLTNASEGQTSVQRVAPESTRRRRKRRARSKRAVKRASASPLKIVLKKNPVEGKQWVSQSSLSPSESGPPDDCHSPLDDRHSPPDDRHGPPDDRHGPLDDCHGLLSLRTTLVDTPLVLQNTPLAELHQQKSTKASETDLDDPSEAVASSPQLKPVGELTPISAAKPMGSTKPDGNAAVALEGSPPTHRETPDDAENLPRRSEAEVDESSLACETAAARIEVETSADNPMLQASGGGTNDHVSADGMRSADDDDGVTPRSGDITSSPVSQPVIMAQGQVNSEDLSLAVSSEPSERRVDEARDSCPDLLSDAQQEPSPASGYQPPPKHLERTLKLVAINPSQLVKRPAGDQPVVVLNHPDADIPEVARIMEVINRYRGEVQKVVLSRRTATALSAPENTEVPESNDPTGCAENSVRERFLLRLKLRRLSRKKYEVVGAASPGGGGSGEVAPTFRCWFCGRAFACQETWTVHRQRHLMEWEKPNCDNSLNVAHTG